MPHEAMDENAGEEKSEKDEGDLQWREAMTGKPAKKIAFKSGPRNEPDTECYTIHVRNTIFSRERYVHVYL